MSMVIANTLAQLFKVVVDKLPDIIRAFKEKGSGKVREEDDKVLKMLYEMEKRHAQTEETMERMLQTIQILLQRLEDTSRSSTEDRHTREEVSSELRNLLADAGISPEDLSSAQGNCGATGDDCHEKEPPREQSTQQMYEPSTVDKHSVSCEVCTEMYDRGERLPLILTHCGHTFCRKCLDRINLKRKFKCPSCRQTQDQFEYLPTNFALLDIMVREREREEGASLVEVTKQPESEDEDEMGCSVDKGMSYEEQLALALHISSREAEEEEYKRLAAELVDGVEEDRRGRSAYTMEENECKVVTNELYGQLDREEDLDEEKNQCRGFGGAYDDEVEMLDEMNTHREWEEEKKKKERRRKRRKLREQEDLEMAMAMSLSIQEGNGKNFNE